MSKTETALVDYEAQLAEEAAHVRDTIAAPSGNKISTKGKMFSLPDGSSNAGPMQVVVLDYTSFNSYYPGTYDPQNPASPDCWALNRVIDDLAPSPNAPKPQAESCAACPHNQFGSSGRGKACKNTRRLVVTAPNATEKTLPMTLEVSPGAIKVFDAYVEDISKTHHSMPVRVITEVSFDPNKAFPSLVFKDLGLHPNLGAMMGMRERAQSVLMKEPEVRAAG